MNNIATKAVSDILFFFSRIQRFFLRVCYKYANFTALLHFKQITRSIFKQTDHDNDFRIQFFE